MVLHASVRPYEDPAGNFVVILFTTCELLGVLGAAENTPLQWAHVLLMIVAFFILFIFSVKDGISEVRQRQQDENDQNKETLTKCERYMLVPFLIIVAVPSISVAMVFLVGAVMTSAFEILCREMSTSKSCCIECGCLFRGLHPILRLVLVSCLWPVYLLVYACTHTHFRAVVDSVRLGTPVERFADWIWVWMFPKLKHDGANLSDMTTVSTIENGREQKSKEQRHD